MKMVRTTEETYSDLEEIKIKWVEHFTDEYKGRGKDTWEVGGRNNY